jgi:hypothetical protein
MGAALQLCASVAIAAQVVVCRGPEGHIEIESVLDGDCCPTGGRERNLQALRASQGCEGCVDTPLLRAGLSTPGKGTLDGLAPTLWRIAPVPILRHAMCAAPSVATDSSRPRRSVVLLI